LAATYAPPIEPHATAAIGIERRVARAADRDIPTKEDQWAPGTFTGGTRMDKMLTDEIVRYGAADTLKWIGALNAKAPLLPTCSRRN